MKIISVTSEQFEFIWGRLIPSQRMSEAMPTPNIVLPHLNATIVLEGEVQYRSLAGANISSITELGRLIRADKTEPISEAALSVAVSPHLGSAIEIAATGGEGDARVTVPA